MAEADISDDLCARVSQAHREASALYINGGGSKRHILGRDCKATSLEVSAHRGIVDYHPGELVLTARAGTPIADLCEVLAGEDQELPFDPPHCNGAATLGGTLACNLSGPARPWRGSARDMLLGLQLISGAGELLNFGGQVMKNVAGYDIGRLQAGALGTLGVISTASLKVLPRAEATLTLRQEMAADAAVELMNRRAASPRPLTGACWTQGTLYLRLAGAASAVRHTAQLWGGDTLEEEDARVFWEDVRELRCPALAHDKPLWRLSVRPTAPVGDGDGVADGVIDWAGAQRWLASDDAPQVLFDVASHGGGHAQLVRGGDRAGEVRSPVADVQQRLQRELKKRFDPAGILNPGRLYSWL